MDAVSLALLVVCAGLVSGWVIYLALTRRRRAEWRQRVLVEDALKHLHDCEYRRHQATLESLGGALHIAPDRAADLVARLQTLSLVRTRERRIELTPEGMKHARRIVRIHRLWECYLADQTGLSPQQWHDEADRREHAVTAEEAERLAASMAHPRFDPHGDPIPTPAGEISPARGRPLSDLPAGTTARIVHIEDEPEAVYSRLVREGLTAGMEVRVTSVSTGGIRIESHAGRHTLPLVVAGNLTVEENPAPEGPETLTCPLSTLSQGQRACVVAISPACRGVPRRRLLDLGILPGTPIEAALQAAGGDPTAYLIRGALVALRRTQAEQIFVTPIEEVAA